MGRISKHRTLLGPDWTEIWEGKMSVFLGKILVHDEAKHGCQRDIYSFCYYRARGLKINIFSA